jgi:hypothetical protein
VKEYIKSMEKEEMFGKPENLEQKESETTEEHLIK